MDEPTSVLTPQEVERLFATLRQLSAEGCSILYISHKLQEIKDLCHHATILRGGKVVGECDPTTELTRGMAQMMIGAELKTLARRGARPRTATRFNVDNLSLATDQPFGINLKSIGFEVARRRNLRHRRRRRQRPERADAGIVRRVDRSPALIDPARRQARRQPRRRTAAAPLACAAFPKSATATPRSPT